MSGLINKRYMLMAGSVILLVACYRLAFVHTIAAWQLNSSLKQQVTSSGTLSVQPEYLQRKKGNLNQLVASYKSDSVSFRAAVVEKASLIADSIGVKLMSVPTEDAQPRTDSVQMQKMVFQGAYFSLLRLTEQLTKQQGIGLIRSIKIKSSSDRAEQTASQPIMEIHVAAVK